jgi:hypothetical protein
VTKVMAQPSQLNEFDVQGGQLFVLGVQDRALSLLLLRKVLCPALGQVCDTCSICARVRRQQGMCQGCDGVTLPAARLSCGGGGCVTPACCAGAGKLQSYLWSAGSGCGWLL